MREKWLTSSVVALVLLGLLAYLFIYSVRVDQVVAHYRSGKVHQIIRPDLGVGNRTPPSTGDVPVLTEAGWYFKMPLRDRIERFDQRVRHVDGVLAQTQLRDGNQVTPRVYATWRIVDPVAFEGSLDGDEDRARADLKTYISNEGHEVFGRYGLDEIVNSDTDQLQFDQIEAEILAGVREGMARAQKAYGIELLSLGITWIALPEGATAAVFGRMQSERKTEVERHVQEGERAKRTEVAKAQEKRDKILADAQAYAKQVTAEAEAEAAQYYAKFSEAPELANFLRELESLRIIFRQAADANKHTKLLLTSDTLPMSRLLAGPIVGNSTDASIPDVQGATEAGGGE